MAEHPEIVVKSNVPAWKNIGLVVIIVFGAVVLASYLSPVEAKGPTIRITKKDAKLLEEIYQEKRSIRRRDLSGEEIYQETIRRSMILIPDPQRAQFAPFKEARFFHENGLIKISAKVTGIDDLGTPHAGELIAEVNLIPEIGGYNFKSLKVVDVHESVLPE